jgi:hypothetical protein
MGRRLSLLVGLALLLVGALALASNALAYLLGPDLMSLPWRIWPLLVVALGLLFVVAPFLAPGRRGLGGLFIPGVPILVTGGVLLFTSVFDAWGAWSWLWPLEVLGVALGFLFAAVYTRVLWLLIPAIIIAANGLLFQFCAITGWWGIWAVLWTIEPLSLGLALLVFGLIKRSMGLLVAAAGLLGLGGVALIGMTALASLQAVWPGSWFVNLVGPFAIMAAGLLLLILSLLHRPASVTPVATIAEAGEAA